MPNPIRSHQMPHSEGLTVSVRPMQADLADDTIEEQVIRILPPSGGQKEFVFCRLTKKCVMTRYCMHIPQGCCT